MFAIFKRALRAAGLLAHAETSPIARPDEPKPAIDDRALTPASWPAGEQRPSPFAWTGGCCG